MSLQLDHVVIAVHDLDAAAEDYRRLGFTVGRGGMHANRATHNALITFANGTYLELLAATGEKPMPGLVDFSLLLRHGEGWVGYALRSDDLEADAARLGAEGFVVGEIIPGERLREDGTPVRWKLALLAGDFVPFLIQDVTPRERRIPNDPAVTTHANTAAGLCGVEITVRDLPGACVRYARLFGQWPVRETTGCADVGEVILREDTQARHAENLYALRLACASRETDCFPLEKTHGVRFVPCHAPESWP